MLIVVAMHFKKRQSEFKDPQLLDYACFFNDQLWEKRQEMLMAEVQMFFI